jgi:membrane associated rhomboid family serine protease
MSTEPAESTRRRPTFLWVVIAVLAGAAYAIVAITNAPGVAYIIVAIVASACYALVGAYTRRRQ